MKELIPYIQMILVSGFAYTFYAVVLRRKPKAGFNRIFLLSSVLISLFVFIPEWSQSGSSVLVYQLPEIEVGAEIVKQPINLISHTYVLWLIPSIFFLLLFIVRLFRIAQLSRQSVKMHVSGMKVHVLNQDHTAFSFLNRIYISQNLLESEDVDVILSHERSHIRHFHSSDVIFMELICLLGWFNPFFWLIRKELADMHELQADSDVVQKGVSVRHYQEQLLRYAMQATSHAFVPAFSKLLIKKRIKVLNQVNNQRRNVMKYMLSLPVLFLLMQFSFQSVSFAASTGNEIVTEQHQEVETTPQYKGGNEAMIKKLVAEIKYPKAAQKAEIEGTVYVKFTITKNGEMSDVTVLKGFHEECDAEALRVVKTLTEWTPATKDGKNVSAEMTIPIKFKLK